MKKLEKTARYAGEHSNFYNEIFKKVGRAPVTISSLEDLSKLPFTCAGDLLKNPYYFLCVSQSEVLRGYSVETLAGENKQIFFTRDDLENVVDAISSVFDSMGISPNTNLAIVFPAEHEWGVPNLIRRAAAKSGGRTTQVDVPDLDQQLSQLKVLNPEMIIGSAQQLFFLSTVMLKQDISLTSYPKSVIVSHGCIPYIFTEKAKATVERAWRNRVFEHFGITEMGFNVAFECGVHDGLHINEVDVYAEVIDPETGDPLPSGERGELVLTSLSQRAMPILRYRTGYVSTIIDRPCTCGDALTRRLKIHSTLATDEDLLNQPLVFRPF